MEKKKYYYTYVVLCTDGSFKGKKYFGKHTTTILDDGYIGSGTLLKKYLKKYPSGYKKTILGFYNSEEELNKAEIELIKPHLMKDYCLNIAIGGTGGDTFTNNPNKEEISRKKSESLKGEKSYLYGKHLPLETKQKLREANLGKKLTPEQIEKNRLSHIGITPWNKGLTKEIDERLIRQPLSQETKDLISINTKKAMEDKEIRKKCAKGGHKQKGIPKSKESNEKRSKALKGIPLTQERKNNISKACKGHVPPNKGTHMGEDQKQKLREAILGTHRVYDNSEHTKWHMEKD